MDKCIEKFVEQKHNGLMLLDLPTGFGKTFSALKFIKNFVDNNDSIKRVFFITNQKNNLPDDKLKEILGDDYSKCLYLKPYVDSVSEKLSSTCIDNSEVVNSIEYKNLRMDVDELDFLKKRKKELADSKLYNKDYKETKRRISAYKQKIEKDTEVKFRKFIKTKFFYNKSTNDKDKFLRTNKWLSELYPTCCLRDSHYKIILASTKKFFMPIDTFARMPFYIYNNTELLENSIVFIDEFDTSKDVLLNQVIDDGLKYEIDIFSLFLNIYYALNNTTFPNVLLKNSEYRKEKIEKNEWQDIRFLLDKLKEHFNSVYSNFNLQFLLKSKGFEEKRAFLFDSGRFINIFRDNDKKYLNTEFDSKENHISIYAENEKSKLPNENRFENIIKNVKNALSDFVANVAYIAKNYSDYKNQSVKKYQNRYSFEESVLTILSAFNISSEFRQYLLERIIDKDANLKLNLSVDEEDRFMRNGFEYTIIEDDDNHDLQTKSSFFQFKTTPEDILTKLSIKSRVVGISATASIDTVIGNYDIDYLKRVLGDDFYTISLNERQRLREQFEKNQEIYTQENIKINCIAVDDLNIDSEKEKCEQIIKEIFNKDLQQKYLDFISNSTEHYYLFSACKLLKLYKNVAENKNIYSFLAFLNSFPIVKTDEMNKKYIDREFLQNAVNDLKIQNDYTNAPIIHIVKSENFEEEFDLINMELTEGKKVFVISTYKTIGNSKNIQYSIPNITEIKNNTIIIDTEKNEKDFDAVYLSAPTNLIQNLDYNSINKVKDLCKYLFQQEYLCYKHYLTVGERNSNIEDGFRKVFYGDAVNKSFKMNLDVSLHTAQLVIQAIGRICRCKNKNKQINIFYDMEVLNRLSLIKKDLYKQKDMFNKEFVELLNQAVSTHELDLIKYTSINKEAYGEILKILRQSKRSQEGVDKWIDLREFALKYPTSDYIPDEYQKFYFKFENACAGYSFKLNRHFEFINLSPLNNYELNQVSAENSGLLRLMKNSSIKKFFEENGYAIDFKKSRYVMTPNFYKQIYLAALGEAVGKYIIDNLLGFEIEPLESGQQYEAFDFKVGNLYFDFKNWNNFFKDSDKYCKDISWKLSTVNGWKAVIINLFKRGDHKINHSLDDRIIQVPYMINDENEIDYSFLEKAFDSLI